MDRDDIADELQRIRERQHALGDEVHANVQRLGVLEMQMRDVLARFISRDEFTPVARIVYGLAASIMGAFIMAVAAVVFRVLPK